MQECQSIQAFCGEQLVRGMTEKEAETLRALFNTVLDNGTRLAEEVPS